MSRFFPALRDTNICAATADMRERGWLLCGLLRQGYLAAWGMLTHSYGQETETSGAVLADDGLGGFDTHINAVEAKSAGNSRSRKTEEAVVKTI